MLVDTHCHLTHERFGGDLSEALRRAREAGIGTVIGIASNLEESLGLQGMIAELRRADSGSVLPSLRATAGIHPHESEGAPVACAALLRELLDAHPEIVAIGECGLDYHYDFSSPEAQRRVFEAQIEVAAERNLPLVVHCRSAEEEMASWIRRAAGAGVRGVLHCFPGDAGLLAVALEGGWNVSFTGMVTFPSFAGGEAVRTVPGDRYMLETDGPYLAPVPYRGKRNEPAFLVHTRDRIAQLRGISPSQVEKESSRTAEAFFGLSGDDKTSPGSPMADPLSRVADR